MALSGCVVSDFDELRERSEARRAEAGEACDRDAGENSAPCTGESELDAQTEEAEPADMDAAPRSQSEDGAQPQRDAGASTDANGGADTSADGDTSANSCLDVVSDPKNCGHCGLECSATSARVSCENTRCVRACEDGYDDCNNDLVLGLMGNGCERKTDSDPNNCGQCRRRCTPPSDGFASCDKQLCNGHRLQPSDLQAGTLYGNASGGMAYNQDCPSGQVLVGIDGTGTTIVYGIGARCAPLKMAQVNGTITVSTGNVTTTQLVGGIIDPTPPTYRRECPPGSFVTGIAGTLWNWPGTTVPSVRTLAITCGSARVGADRKVSIVAGTPLTIGEEEAMPLMRFTRQCTPPSAVSAIRGRAGAYLDSIQVDCSKLAVVSEPVGSSTSAASE